jgi:hypothetical protein
MPIGRMAEGFAAAERHLAAMRTEGGGVDRSKLAELHASHENPDGTFGHTYAHSNLETRQAFKQESAAREKADMDKLREKYPRPEQTGRGYQIAHL